MKSITQLKMKLPCAITMMFVLGTLAQLTHGAKPDAKTAYPKDRPNILFIMSDDHAPQAWGPLATTLKEHVKTPNIDKLAKQGTLLSNSFCTNSICTPSRAAILTGQYSHKNGVYSLAITRGGTLDPDKETVATILQESGYETALIGKWHLHSDPVGFDYWSILDDKNRFGQGRYDNPLFREQGKKAEVFEGFSTDVITDKSLQWLKQHKGSQPFLLFCHFKAPHEPFCYPKRLNKLYDGITIPEPAGLHEDTRKRSGRSFSGASLEYLGHLYTKNPEKYRKPIPDFKAIKDPKVKRSAIYQKYIKDYLRSVAGIDENIGRLLEYLDDSGLSNNTIVIYTTDQGFFLGEHGFYDKRMMLEHSAKMPFVIRYPGQVGVNKQLEEIILNVDFAPTLLDYAGIETPGFMQGRSFRSNLEGNTPKDWRTDMYYRYWLHSGGRPAHYGIRTQQYKLIFYYGMALPVAAHYGKNTTPSWEFYDLHKDPNEFYNQYKNPEYKGIITQLTARLFELKDELGDSDDHFPELMKITNQYKEKRR